MHASEEDTAARPGDILLNFSLDSDWMHGKDATKGGLSDLSSTDSKCNRPKLKKEVGTIGEFFQRIAKLPLGVKPAPMITDLGEDPTIIPETPHPLP